MISAHSLVTKITRVRETVRCAVGEKGAQRVISKAPSGSALVYGGADPVLVQLVCQSTARKAHTAGRLRLGAIG